MGIDRKTAADFSFFLAVPTLAGATALQLAKHHDQLAGGDGDEHRASAAVVSFVVAIVVVKAFVAYHQALRLRPFGWYRIVAGAAALVWLVLR